MPGVRLILSRRGAGVLLGAATTTVLVLALAFSAAAWAAASAPNWNQLNPVASPPIKGNAAGAYDPATRQFVMFGGLSNQNLFQGDTWIWDGSNWVQQFPATTPEPREGARMAYDAATNQLIMFGGYDGYQEHGLSDTWTWNGSNWVALHPANSPPPTSDEGMAYDPATKQILIFGGYQWFANGTGATQQNMWAWTGTNWEQLSPATLPTRRIGAALAWDQATSQMLLFGGNLGGQYLNDTWLWNTSNWVQQSPAASPPVRSYAGLVYDPVTAQMLLFGGGQSSQALNDTWTWSGSNWTRQSPATAFSPTRYQPATDYDAYTQQVLMFGGAQNGVSYLNDTWAWSRFAVATRVLPTATVGLNYSTNLTPLGGRAPYTWSVTAGSLPAGLTLSPTGAISGAPQTAGNSSFTLSVTDAAGATAARAFTITTNPSPRAGVWVSNGGNSVLNAFPLTANGNVSPSASLGGPLTQLNAPGGLVFDARGDLYVSNSDTSSVTVYAPGASGNVKPLRTLAGPATGLANPGGIGLDASGRLYVTNQAAGSVSVYASGATGNQAPVQTIAGMNTGLRQPAGVTVDAAGHMWVADRVNNSLVEFAQDANGNATPLATITGGLTQLNGPGGVAVDSHDDLLVPNTYGESITEYANNPPYGDVSPTFAANGGQSQLDFPEDLDVDAANDVYVVNQFGGLNIYAPAKVSPYAVVTGSNTGLFAPHAVAVVPPMSIATSSLPPAALGRRYSARVFAILGIGGMRWRVVRGRLPRGLHLRTSGAITGSPRKLGTSTFTVQVRANSRRVPSQTRRLRLTVRRAPTVTLVKPAHGRARGNTRVRITGTGFAVARNATVIAFGRLRALSVRCRSGRVCIVRTPAHARGGVKVTVTVRGLTSARRRANRFTYRR